MCEVKQCRKGGREPVYYDDRNRDGFLNGGWAHASCDRPDAPHWRKLAALPYTKEPWKDKYPTLAGISTDFENPDSPDFPVNPAHVILENNVIINSRGYLGQIARSVYDYNEIGANYRLKGTVMHENKEEKIS